MELFLVKNCFFLWWVRCRRIFSSSLQSAKRQWPLNGVFFHTRRFYVWLLFSIFCRLKNFLGIKCQPGKGKRQTDKQADAHTDRQAHTPRQASTHIHTHAHTHKQTHVNHRYRRRKIDCSSLFTVPATSAAQNSLLFFFFCCGCLQN
jgi:hypothetical protein